MSLEEFLEKYNIAVLDDLVQRINEFGKKLPVEFVYQAAEYLNPNRDLTAAFYTDTMICKQIMSELPNFDDKSHIRVLEPSVGAGNFLPFIADKYKDKKIVEFYLVDIDEKKLYSDKYFTYGCSEKYLSMSGRIDVAEKIIDIINSV